MWIYYTYMYTYFLGLQRISRKYEQDTYVIYKEQFVFILY